MRIIAFGLISAFLFAGCSAIDEASQYTVGFENTLVIADELKLLDNNPESDSINLFVSSETLPTYEERLAARGDKPEKVETVYMSRFGFTLNDKDSSLHLDFLRDVEFFLESPGLPDLEIGQVTNFPNGFRGVEVGITFPWDKDLKNYLENGYKVKVSFTADKQIDQAISFRCSAIFKIDTRKFGI